jgi:predicted enzyme related to lactoylglutathione lyase
MVDDLGAWIAAHPDVTVVAEPFDIPGGRAATLHDPSGNAIHLFDQSTVEEATG